MKAILELKRIIADDTYNIQQFYLTEEEKISCTTKNILFINPQLSKYHLYTMLLPSLIMGTDGDPVVTAITTISKYDPQAQLLGGKEVELSDEMIMWGEYFVFPFTTQPLYSELYIRIRELNKYAKIVYSVDFNFYELSERNPYKYIFDESTVMNDVEDNIFFADICLVSNRGLQQYLFDKCQQLLKDKYKGVYTKLCLGYIPFFKSSIMYENVDYETLDSTPVQHTVAVQKELEKISKVANDIKKKDIKKNDKKIPLKTKPLKIRKIALKSVKTNEKKDVISVTEQVIGKQTEGSNSVKSGKRSRKK